MVKTLPPVSLVEGLRSHMPWGQKNQNIRQKQYCNRFNKDFEKDDPHQRILKKKERAGLEN